MDIGKRDFLAGGVGLGLGLAASSASAQEQGSGGGRVIASVNSGTQPSSVDMNYKPRRVNKVIELWEDGQPAYFETYASPQDPQSAMNAYADGKKMAQTWGDAIAWEAEHGPLDFVAFAAFMRGLKDGGPTRSGHATPAVFVEPPCLALSEEYAYANSWILCNFLDLGAHGFHICHARDPKAVAVYAQMAARYPFDYPDTPKVKYQGLGLRNEGPGEAPRLWGVSTNKYFHIADVWPLNPRGEIIIGVKVEDKFAQANMAEVLATKGIAFAEWAPGDSALSNFGLAAFPEEQTGRGGARPPEQQAVLDDIRARVQAECKKNNVKFWDYGDIIQIIKNGMMITHAGEQNAIKGREYTKRKMPV